MAARWGHLRALRLPARPTKLECEEEARTEQRRRAQAARLRRLQRLLEPSGPPGRTLSRQAVEQMQYLRQDSPEEWPIARLARSFQVSPDVVGRVLHSRFTPSPTRVLKQNGRLAPSRAGAEALAPEAACKKTSGSGAPLPGDGPPQRHSAELTARDLQPGPLWVVQKGQDFLDEDGNLLYRIPA